MTQDVQTHFRACHLCEAICGLAITTKDNEITSIKGDPNDPFSAGHMCPKALALKDLQEDPDRLEYPVIKTPDGWQQATWDEALNLVAEKTVALQKQHGDDCIGVYAGNPNVHNYGNLTHGRVLRKALQTKNNFSATSLDQLPHQLLSLELYGHQFLLPVPDIDRTDYMLMLGANPLASNGSMMTVPNVTKRLQNIQKRGGQFVVIDPRKTETAKVADEHLFIKPGTDVYLLLAIVNQLFSNQDISLGHLELLIDGVDEVASAVSRFTPSIATTFTGIPEEKILEITQRLASTPKAVVYGRMGVSVQQHGTLCQWLIHIINMLTGHLDAEGGAMFTSPAVGYVAPGSPGGGHFAKFHSRVSKLPEFAGEFPASVMAEEMLTEGEGQIRGMYTLAGNPVLSSPNGRQLDDAFTSLDFMVSVDFYINETTKHADVILPPTSPLEHEHYDFAFLRLAVRNSTRMNPPIFTPAEDRLHDWQIYNELGQRIADLKGTNSAALPAPESIIDHELQNGLYGKDHDLNLSLATLQDHPHGIDLGPLKPSLPERVCTKNGRIDLAIPYLLAALAKLDSQAANTKENEFLLIGRRHVKSNNSWMHNYERLVKGRPHWQLLMHPQDLAEQGFEEGTEVSIRSKVGEVKTIVKATEDMMPGVVCLPHGWGHKRSDVKLRVAAQQEGVSVNDITDDKFYDQLTGNAALNGVPVTLSKAS